MSLAPEHRKEKSDDRMESGDTAAASIVPSDKIDKDEEAVASAVHACPLPLYHPKNPHDRTIAQAPGHYWTSDADTARLPVLVNTHPINRDHALVDKWIKRRRIN